MRKKKVEKQEPSKAEITKRYFERTRYVYIRIVKLDEAKRMGLVVTSEMNIPADVNLYALNDARGHTLGITDTQTNAEIAALQNDFILLRLH